MSNLSDLDVQQTCCRSSLFRGLDGVELDDVLKAVEVREEQSRAVVFRQGDTPSRLFLLAKGFVKISQINGDGTPVTLRMIGPGEILACVAVFKQISYPATAMTMADSVLLTWPASMILGLIDKNPRLKDNALEIVGHRTQDLAHQLTRMATERVEQRIARALLCLTAQVGRKVPEGLEVGVPLSRQDIAEIAGTDFYNVSRQFQKWADQGIIIARRLHVTVLDLSALEAIAGKSH